MESFNFNIQGEGISVVNTNLPSLCITWAKAFNEIYCHHASLTLPLVINSLFAPEIAKVSVNVRFNTIEKGVVKNFSDKTISRYLPVKFDNQSIIIQLNSTEILDSLCENGWTTLKGGKRGAPKSFPLAISVSLEDTIVSEFPFLYESGKFPFTICETVFNSLNDSEKVETTIYLES